MLNLTDMTHVQWHLCAELDRELLVSIGGWRGHVWYQLIRKGHALFASTEPDLVHAVANMIIDGPVDSEQDDDLFSDKTWIAELYRIQSDMRDMRREAALEAKTKYWKTAEEGTGTQLLAAVAQYMQETGVTSYGEAVHQLYV